MTQCLEKAHFGRCTPRPRDPFDGGASVAHSLAVLAIQWRPARHRCQAARGGVRGVGVPLAGKGGAAAGRAARVPTLRILRASSSLISLKSISSPPSATPTAVSPAEGRGAGWSLRQSHKRCRSFHFWRSADIFRSVSQGCNR
jgi:hypothetical protein